MRKTVRRRMGMMIRMMIRIRMRMKMMISRKVVGTRIKMRMGQGMMMMSNNQVKGTMTMSSSPNSKTTRSCPHSKWSIANNLNSSSSPPY